MAAYTTINIKIEVRDEIARIAEEMSVTLGTSISQADVVNIMLKEYKEHHEIE